MLDGARFNDVLLAAAADVTAHLDAAGGAPGIAIEVDGAMMPLAEVKARIEAARDAAAIVVEA